MDISLLAKKLKPPDRKLFFESKDTLDIRLGKVVSADLETYRQSRFVLLSCAQDQGVRRNMGRPGAAKAPEAIRKALYKLAAPLGLQPNQLFDLGDTAFEAELEEIHDHHSLVVKQLLNDGKIVIVLGGGNDLSYPDVKAVQSVFPGSLTFNIDTHLDIRRNPVRNSGTPYRQLIEETIIDPTTFHEIGYQSHANAGYYLTDARALGINLIPLADLQSASGDIALQQISGNLNCSSSFLGFDMDVVKAADAPGVSAPSPTGLSAEQSIQLMDHLTTTCNIRLFEITEVNPDFDIDNRTAKLAAILVHRFIEQVIGQQVL